MRKQKTKTKTNETNKFKVRTSQLLCTTFVNIDVGDKDALGLGFIDSLVQVLDEFVVFRVKPKPQGKINGDVFSIWKSPVIS